MRQTNVRFIIVCILAAAITQGASARPCPTDWNYSSQTTVQDIFDFLGAWFSGNGDYNRNHHSTVQDIFDFLSDWFAHCETCDADDYSDITDFQAQVESANEKLSTLFGVRLYSSDAIVLHRTESSQTGEFQVVLVNSCTQRVSATVGLARRIQDLNANAIYSTAAGDGSIVQIMHVSRIVMFENMTQDASVFSVMTGSSLKVECDESGPVEHAYSGVATSSEDSVDELIIDDQSLTCDVTLAGDGCGDVTDPLNPNRPLNNAPCNERPIDCRVLAACIRDDAIWAAECTYLKQKEDCCVGYVAKISGVMGGAAISACTGIGAPVAPFGALGGLGWATWKFVKCDKAAQAQRERTIRLANIGYDVAVANCP